MMNTILSIEMIILGTRIKSIDGYIIIIIVTHILRLSLLHHKRS